MAGLRRLHPTSYIPHSAYCADETYAYGQKWGSKIVLRWRLDSLQDPGSAEEEMVDLPEGRSMEYMWAGARHGFDEGEVWAMTRDGRDAWLYRSMDSGETFQLIHQMPQNITIIDRGLCVGYPNGVRTYAMAEYNEGTNAPIRIRVSTDGQNWETKCTMTAPDSIRHWHCIVWDPYEHCFWLGSGDIEVNAAIIKWDGRREIPDATPKVLRDTHGFELLHDDTPLVQTFRTVDVVPTPEYIYWGTDTNYPNGPDEYKGIFRATKDLSAVEHVDLGDGRYTNSATTMWTGLLVDNQLLFTDYQQTAVPGEQFLSVYSADVNDAGPGKWREISRVYSRDGHASRVRAFWEGDGKIGWAFSRGAGKKDQGETSILVPDEPWVDRPMGETDNSSPTGLPKHKLWVDTAHPVYWLDGDTGSDSNTGLDPSVPFKTLKGTLEQSTAKVTFGGRIMCRNLHEDTGLDGIDPQWFNYPDSQGPGDGFRGESGHLLTLTGEGSAVLLGQHAGIAQLISLDTADSKLAIENMEIHSTSASEGVRVIGVWADGAELHTSGASIGSTEYDVAAVRWGGGATGHSYHHSTAFYCSGAGTTPALNLREDVEVRLDSCLVAGEHDGFDRRGDGVLTARNTLFYGYNNLGIFSAQSGEDGGLELTNCAFVSGNGEAPSFNSGGIENRQVDTSNYLEVAPVVSADRADNIIGGDLSDLFEGGDPRQGLAQGSDLIGAGEAYPEDGPQAFDISGRKFAPAPSIGYLEVPWYPDQFDLGADEVVDAETRRTRTFTVSGAGDAELVVTPLGAAQVSVQGGEFTSSPTTAQDGNTIAVRLTAPSAGGTASGGVDINGVRDMFALTVLEPTEEPGDVDPFSFLPRTGVPRDEWIESDSVTVSGLATGQTAPVSISGGQYRIGSGSWTSSSGTVSNGDQVQVRVMSSASQETTTSAVLTMGTRSGTFQVRTTSAEPIPEGFNVHELSALATTGAADGNTLWLYANLQEENLTEANFFGSVGRQMRTGDIILNGATGARLRVDSAGEGFVAVSTP